MIELTIDDFRRFTAEQKEVTVGNVVFKIGEEKKIKQLIPSAFNMETTTVWSFPKRGEWATHPLNAKYRGNWTPHIPRNLILKYTKPGDTVLDSMVGSGTTLIECKLLGRNGTGIDINRNAIMVTMDRLDFNDATLQPSIIKTFVGDAKNLDLVGDESIDLIATHPPYMNIIHYSEEKLPGDLSMIGSVHRFTGEMEIIAKECFRVLKPGHHCTILMGETRKRRHFIPLSFRVMQTFLKVGFILKEDIIKLQWHMKSAREQWAGKYDFYKIAHEHLFIFRKPEREEKISIFKNSMLT